MSLKFFILGLCVLVSFVQISSVQGQDSPADDDNDQQDEGEGETEDEIEQRRKITSIMNSAVNIIEPETERKDVYTQIQNNQMGYMGSYNPPPRPLPQRPHYPPTGAFFEPPPPPPIRQPQYIQPQPQPQPYYEPKYQAPTISQYISPQLSEFNPKPSPPSTTRAPPRPPFRLIPLPPPPPPQPSSPPPPPMVVPKETPSRPSYPSAQPPPSQGLGSIGGNPLGGLLGTILNLVTNALPLLKPLMSLLKTILPGLKNLLGPLLKSILNGFPLLSNLLKLLGPLFKLPAKILQLLSAIGGCLKSIFGVLLKGFKFLMKGFKILLNLLPVLPAILDFIPELIEKLWRIWRSIRYIVLYPIRLFKRSLQRVARLLYGIPRYLGLIMRSIAHFLVSPVAILGFLFKRGFLLFHDYVITPVTRLKYFLIHLFDVLVGPLNIIRHFIMELICLVFKTPARIIRSIMRSIFVNGILNTIRYIKTVIYEIIVFPWSRHYADMFPSAGNIHNYLIPSQAIPCRGVAC